MDGRPLVSVLGATGFVGSAVVRALATEPVRVRAVARTLADVPGALAADLTDESALAGAVRGADAIVVVVNHVSTGRGWRVAGDDPVGTRVNLGVARTIARLCEAGATGTDSPVVVFAGSTTQAGHHSGPLTGAEPDEPVSPYDRQKLAAERALINASAAGACRAIGLRLPTIYGPATSATGTDKGIVSSMARRAIDGVDLTLWDGTVERDLLHVEDLAAAFVAALRNADRLTGSHWLLGRGESVPMRTLFDTIAGGVADLTGEPRVAVGRVPPPDYASSMDLSSTHIDPSAFEETTGWSATVDWRTGVRRTLDFLVSTRR